MYICPRKEKRVGPKYTFGRRTKVLPPKLWCTNEAEGGGEEEEDDAGLTLFHTSTHFGACGWHT